MGRDKRASLAEIVAAVEDGDTIALGGNTLHRAPCSVVHALVQAEKRRLNVVKTAGAYDIDLLAGMGCLARASVGFVGFETVFGLAPSYRREVEGGRLVVDEHACYTVIAGLRAAIQGVPFMPVAGLTGSDLLQARGFHTIADPYSDATVVAIPALEPDIAVIHVQEADREGNGRIVGTRFEDVLMANAAKRVFLTTERIVEPAAFIANPEIVAIPSFLVEAVIETPNGSWPCSCAGEYDYDAEYLADYVAASRDPERLRRFVESRIFAVVVA